MRFRLLALLLLLMSACGGGGTEAAKPPAAEEPTATTTHAGPAADCVEAEDIIAVDNEYNPICVTTSDGAELRVANQGGLPHTFTIRDADVDEVLDPGEDVTVTVPGSLETNAETEFHCRFHPGMVGYLYVARA